MPDPVAVLGDGSCVGFVDDASCFGECGFAGGRNGACGVFGFGVVGRLTPTVEVVAAAVVVGAAPDVVVVAEVVVAGDVAVVVGVVVLAVVVGVVVLAVVVGVVVLTVVVGVVDVDADVDVDVVVVVGVVVDLEEVVVGVVVVVTVEVEVLVEVEVGWQTVPKLSLPTASSMTFVAEGSEMRCQWRWMLTGMPVTPKVCEPGSNTAGCSRSAGFGSK